MKNVTPGEPILPQMTAKWFNSTLQKTKRTGLSSQTFFEDKDIILGYNESSAVVEYLDPIAVFRRNNNDELVYTNSILRGDPDEYNWGVCLQKFRSLSTGDVALAGVTLANVEIRKDYHKYVTIKGTKLVSSCYGKGQLVVANDEGPSLITIGTSPLGNGIAFIEEEVPKRVGMQMGSIVGKYVDIDDLGKLVLTEDDVTIWNMQVLPANNGYIQWKEVCGKKLVDVSPCEE